MKKQILYFKKTVEVACDEKCNKAWGSSSRPKVYLDDDPDNFAFLTDDELPEAPEDPQTYEGGQAKPTSKSQIPNKWCVRECERCVLYDIGKPKELPDFSKRVHNISQ